MHIFKKHSLPAEYMKYVKSILRMILINTIILFSFFSCNDSPVGPEQLTPGRRDYTWSIDTLVTFPVNQINDMWGASSNDVWCSLNAGALNQTLYHYDGKNWDNKSTNGLIPISLFGFSANNIWAGGIWGQFWKYDSVSWKKFSEHSLQEYPKIIISKIFGLSPNDIYAGGIAFGEGDLKKIVLMHFNGTKWEFINTPDLKEEVIDIVQEPIGDKTVIINALGENSFKVIAYNGIEFKVLYEGSIRLEEYSEVELWGSSVYVSIGHKLYKYKNGQLIYHFDLPVEKYYARLWGRNEKDIFCLTKDQTGKFEGIGHFNGSDLETIYPKFPTPRDAFMFSNQAMFFTKDANGNNLILKGTIK